MDSKASKKAVKVVLAQQEPDRRRLWILLGLAAFIVSAIAATLVCVFVFAARDVETSNSREQVVSEDNDVVIFQLNFTALGQSEKVLLRPKEGTAEFRTDTMDVLHYFQKNVTLLHILDDHQLPTVTASDNGPMPEGKSMCLLTSIDPNELRPDQMLRVREDQIVLAEYAKTVYYDIVPLPQQMAETVAIDDRMLSFCGNSSVYMLKPYYEVMAGASRRRKRAPSSSASDPYIHVEQRKQPAEDGSSQQRDVRDYGCHGPNALHAARAPCCLPQVYRCPPKVRYHCYMKLMNGMCDQLACAPGSVCDCPVKSILICVRVKGGQWLERTCCRDDQDQCNNQCVAVASPTTTPRGPPAAGRLPPPEITVKIFARPLPRKTLADLLAERRRWQESSYYVSGRIVGAA